MYDPARRCVRSVGWWSVGGVATNSVVGAVIGAGVGALAGAVLVETANNGWCTYRYNGKLYRDRCQS